MNRWQVLVAGAIAGVGAVFVSGAARPPQGEPAAEGKKAKPPVVIGQKTAVFNMAAVMRDFGQAKYQVYLLNNKKAELSRQMLAWRAEYVKLQTELRDRPAHPQKEKMGQDMLALARRIEDEDRKIGKQLNDDAGAIIADLYDRMKAVVDETARRNGFQIVLAYPDAVTPEELQSAYIKELKLKPPAAQPFYVDPDADITAAVVKALNDKYPPLDPETGRPVDVSKLVAPPPARWAGTRPGRDPHSPGAFGRLPRPRNTTRGRWLRASASSSSAYVATMTTSPVLIRCAPAPFTQTTPLPGGPGRA
jgi:Skp family chaperone for outer membrane proteins